MILTLYTTSSRHKAVFKKLTKVTEINLTALEELDPINPSLTLTNIDPIECNYCYIDSLNSYYFIEGQIKVRNNVTVLNLSLDPLMTYRNELLQLSCFITKAENPNPYYSGYSTNFDVRTQRKSLTFKNAFDNNGSFIMVVS